MSANNDITRKETLDIDNMNSDTSIEKRSVFDMVKVVIAVVLLFALVIGITAGILYITNPQVKKIVNKTYEDYSKSKAEKAVQEVKSDTRISELADYYLSLNLDKASEKMLSIKKEDKKLYEKIRSSMDTIDPLKSKEISVKMDRLSEKQNLLQEEYDKMLSEKAALQSGKSTLYQTLGIRGTIDAIEKELQETMDYDSVSKTLSNMQPAVTARILYYTNPIYVDGIKNRFESEYLIQVEEEHKIYSEFLRKNKSYGSLYGKMEESIAAKELIDEEVFTNEDLSVIFSSMNYMNAAKILNEFEDDNKVSLILQEIKNVEDYQIDFQGSLSTVIANSLKVLKKYDKDVDILRKAYEKMEAPDLAEIIDKLVNDDPVYRTYIIDNERSFRITEREMAVKALKLMKPQLVADMLAELKNTNRVDKAAQISRDIGIPMP